ncbi:MAG: tRNA (N(6)-L-threonylcarbamoyladenosine(37)-C(2))-methylthiotransferase MtaB [Desulfobacterales bacterium]
MPKFTTATLGCKVNQCESESIAQYLALSGWTNARNGSCADLCIINTCTVTHKASMQSRQAIRHAMRLNPGAQIIVTGCYAETEPDALKKIKGIDRIIGQNEKHRIFEIIKNEINIKYPSPFVCEKGISKNGFMPAPAVHSGGRSRAFLKIQDGCNSFCSYCIVPYARGKSRSMPVETAIESIKNLREAGYLEVVLSGIHLGRYGIDLTPETSISSFLGLINDLKIIKRIRLSSIEPNELSPEIIKLAAGSDSICRHFHIPLQSGDDDILNRMRRPYTREFFKTVVKKINESMPDASIGVDVLVGFPGETDSAFDNTYSLIEELPVSYLHVFPFSPRNKTPANSFPERVPADIVKERCARMRRLGNLKKINFYQKAVETIVDVLVENKRDASNDLLKGTSSNYLSVLLHGEDRIKNKIVKAKIDRIAGSFAIGTICS